MKTPPFVKPQLARLVEIPPSGSEWVHEVKYDGYRVLCRIEGGKVTFRTRSGLDWTAKFSGLVEEVKKLKLRSGLLDGEIVAISKDGRTSFGGLQKALSENRTNELIYYVFDLLFLNGKNLQELPLLDRKATLLKVIDKSRVSRVLFSEHWQNDGRTMLAASCHHRLEGIISKNGNDPYQSGRGDSWLKSKCKAGQELVIGGFTRPQGTRQGFGALLMGVYETGDELRYVGRVGTGFDTSNLRDLTTKLKKLTSSESPFTSGSPPASREITWVEPKLVANIEFAGWTDDGILRHASFQGLRSDKKPREVKVEKPTPARSGRLTHPDRIVFPEKGFSKKDVYDYYERAADLLLPFIQNRPLSILRCPDGQAGKCFIQKHTDTEDTISISSNEELLHWIQLGALEFHPGGSRLDDVEHADVLIFDLDPGPGVTWKMICEAALELRKLLKELGLESFLKLSGGKGLHLQVPVAPVYTWELIKAFCKSVATEMSSRHPDRYTATIAKSKRTGRIFIDYLRNGRGATAVAPYSLRARASAGVAIPVSWGEIKKLRAGDQSPMAAKLKKNPWIGYGKLQQRIPLLDTHAKLKARRAP